MPWVQILSLPLLNYVTLSKMLHLSGPQFLPLKWSKSARSLLFKRLSGRIHVRYLEEFLAHSKHSQMFFIINAVSNFSKDITYTFLAVFFGVCILCFFLVFLVFTSFQTSLLEAFLKCLIILGRLPRRVGQLG